MFDCGYPQFKAIRFKEYDWEEFYKDAREDIPPNMPPPLGNPMTVSVFVDSDHGGKKVNRRSRTGVLIFCNKAPIYWYSKQAPGVESSTFGAEFYAILNPLDTNSECLGYPLIDLPVRFVIMKLYTRTQQFLLLL